MLAEEQVTVPLNVVNESTFQLGADFNTYYLDAVIDELRISEIERSAEEIQDSFLAGLKISSLIIQPNSLELLVTQEATPELTAVTNLGIFGIPPEWARWKSSKRSVARVDENGRITGISPGRAKITASLEGKSASATVIVSSVPLPAGGPDARHEDALRARLADGATFNSRLEAEAKLQGEQNPATYTLAQNYPNPFNPETEILFQLPEASHVVLSIYDVLGKEVRRLVDDEFEAGYHGVRWDGKGQNGKPVSSGVYLYRLQAGTFVQVKKMNLVQ